MSNQKKMQRIIEKAGDQKLQKTDMTDIEKMISDCDNEGIHDCSDLKEAYIGFKDWFVRYRNGDKSLEANLKGMIDNNLSEDEAFFILAYTGRCSGWINRNLKDGFPLDSDCKIQFANYLEQALDKMPSSNGGLVFRMDYSGNEKSRLQWFSKHIGMKFQIPYFLSTAKFGYKNSEVVWEIRTLKERSYGKDISDLCNDEEEREVLFKRNSSFEIVSVDRSGKFVNLVEIPANVEIDFLLVGLYYKNI
jgi:hypothetical protein